MAAEQFFNLNRDFVFYFEGWRTSWFPSFSIAPHEKTTCEIRHIKRHPCIQFFLNISHRLRSEWLFILSLARLADIFARHLRMSILGRFLVVFSSITVLKRVNIWQESASQRDWFSSYNIFLKVKITCGRESLSVIFKSLSK